MSSTIATAVQTIELARFATRPADEAAFLAAHATAMRAVRAAHPGLLRVSLVRLQSTSERTLWVDVALWASAEDAHRAAEECPTIPEFAAVLPFMTEDFGIELGAVVSTYGVAA